MAIKNNFLSAGVYTREFDLSFRSDLTPDVGMAVIGPTVRGPAMVPTPVSTYSEYIRTFGDVFVSGSASDKREYKFMTTYAVQEYLRYGKIATVTRILGNRFEPSKSYVLAKEGDVSSVAPPTLQNKEDYIEDAIDQYNTEASTSYTLNDYNSMLDTTSGNNALTQAEFKAINEIIDSLYNQAWNAKFALAQPEMAFELITLSDGDSMNSGNKVAALKGYTTTYNAISNPTGDMEDNGVLRIGSSYNIRWEVANVDPKRGTFDVYIRRGDDTDSRKIILESFNGVSLDPRQSNYIEKVIGTQYYALKADSSGVPYLQKVGSYPNRSKFVRVKVHKKTLNYLTDDGFVRDFTQVEKLPGAFAPTYVGTLNLTGVTTSTPVTAGVGTVAKAAPASGIAVVTGTGTAFDTFYEVGDIIRIGGTAFFEITEVTSATSLKVSQPTGSSTISAGAVHALVTVTAQESTDITHFSKINDISGYTATALSGIFAFGSNGNVAHPMSMYEEIWESNTQGLNLSVDDFGKTNYNDAIDMLSNKDEFDFDLLVTPGLFDLLPDHAKVITRAINMCEDRGDVFYIIDPTPYGKGVGDAQRAAEARNSNFASMYYPWMQIPDPDLGENVWLPPSALITGVIAFNDYVGEKWFAPAGLMRGVVDNSIQTERVMTQNDRDNLYTKNVNPIAQFPRNGVVVWGQKTLQKKLSALDRVNVRRLLIAAKRHVAQTSKYLVFEQNTDETRTKFLNITNPWFENARRKQGLYDFYIQIDEKNNTPDVIDRNEMRAQIYLKPAKTAEFIIVDFMVMPTGAVFPIENKPKEG